MLFRPSARQDIDEMVRIVGEAVDLLKSQGIDQWQKGYPNRDGLLSDLDRRIGWVAEDSGRIVALCAVTFEEEEAYQSVYGGSWLTEGMNYAVVHRMCVTAQCRGMGYPAQMFEDIEQLAKLRGAASIRIDTHPDNIAMQKTIAKAGFTPCGEIVLLRTEEAGDKRLAYEKLLIRETAR